MPSSAAALDRLDAVLEGARLWGVELDPAYRVAAVTVEVAPERHPTAGEGRGDDRLQLLLHPVADVHASLRRSTPEGQVVETFGVEQLAAIVDRFDGPVLSGPLFDLPEPGPGAWGPQFSLEGRSKALDGRAHAVTFHVDDGRGRVFDLRLTFDDVVVRDAAGDEIEFTSP
ncbi:MAG: hypothetical protein KY469_07705 [Actinobacteria bacterium]|nr:hypothetical protein [Actinomycetota bacterium]